MLDCVTQRAWTIEGPRVLLTRLGLPHAGSLERIREMPAVMLWWGEPEPGWPMTDDPASVRYVVRLRGGGDVVRGMIQYNEEADPVYRHAGIDVFLDPAVHGRGLGREAVAVLAAHLVDCLGHRRLVIDPAVDNVRAIACYEAVGFRRVGVMRSYERWPNGVVRDGLLMDLLAPELIRPAGSA
jgi:aminoglycoside 6'-N-acetyltransferase